MMVETKSNKSRGYDAKLLTPDDNVTGAAGAGGGVDGVGGSQLLGLWRGLV
jgi:hypothetical protein